MIIDSATGKIHSPDVVISPNWTASSFEDSELGSLSKVWVRPHGIHSSYRLPVQESLGRWLFVIVFFRGDRLGAVELGFSEDGDESWDTWTLDEELRTKTFHDELLMRDLGEPQ